MQDMEQKMKLIPTRVHGVLDFMTAFALLALPQTMRLNRNVSRLLTTAAATIGYSLLTRYEYGVIKILPFRAHLTLDRLSGLLFCGAPFIFPDEDLDVLNLLVGIGLYELTASQLSSITTGTDH
jgi:hypothetical protein